MSEQYPKAVVCRVLGVARSSLYHPSSLVQNEELDTAMKEICAQFPYYGYRRVTAELRRRGWRINRKRVACLMKTMGLQAKKAVRRRRTTNSEHSFPRYPNLVESLVVQHPDQVWVADITYIRWSMDLCTWRC
jgi:putative transposase